MRPRFPIVLVNIYLHQPSVNAAIHAKRFSSLNDSTVRQKYLSCQSWTHGDMRRCQHVAAFCNDHTTTFRSAYLYPHRAICHNRSHLILLALKLEEYQCFLESHPD